MCVLTAMSYTPMYPFWRFRLRSKNLSEGMDVVADGMNLPFRDESFSHVIISEVLEHLEDDAKSLSEIAGVIKPSGVLVITFPHRRFYFSYDDRFVKHFRRYELAEMESLLRKARFFPMVTRKVLGPLEKMTMCMASFIFLTVQRFRMGDWLSAQPSRKLVIIPILFKWSNKLYAVFAWLAAKIMPRVLSTVLLIKAVKKKLRGLLIKRPGYSHLFHCKVIHSAVVNSRNYCTHFLS